ncbi:MAG: hypothetical protein HY698_14985 [Deltaproteobacteria bacterium]|nr:hypothetical protein [Deltaproteobacteria bacterium]
MSLRKGCHYTMRLLGQARVLLLLPLALLSLGGNCGPPLPDPDSCTDPPNDVQVDAVEIGAGNAGSVFAPSSNGDVVPAEEGSIQAYWIGIRLRVAGASAPSCLPQKTVVKAPSGEVLVSSETPVRAYEQGDGSRITRTLWLTVSGREARSTWATIETKVGDKTTTRSVWIDERYAGPALAGISPNELTIREQETARFKVQLEGAATKYTNVFVSMSDKAVGELSTSGREVLIATGNDSTEIAIYGVKAGGPIDVTVHVGDKSATAKLQVLPAKDGG